jgi:hypothetical protein
MTTISFDREGNADRLLSATPNFLSRIAGGVRGYLSRAEAERQLEALDERRPVVEAQPPCQAQTAVAVGSRHLALLIDGEAGQHQRTARSSRARAEAQGRPAGRPEYWRRSDRSAVSPRQRDRLPCCRQHSAALTRSETPLRRAFSRVTRTASASVSTASAGALAVLAAAMASTPVPAPRSRMRRGRQRLSNRSAASRQPRVVAW